MEFAITLGVGGWIALVVGALAFGVIVEVVTRTATGGTYSGRPISA